MAIRVIMPQMGESVAEGTVVAWLKREGERVEKDEALLTISTDKVDVEIPSPGAGVLSKILVREGETVPIGSPLADIALPEELEPLQAGPPPGEVAGGERWYSPSVLRLAQEEGVDLSQVKGTGSGGRVTRKDVLDFIEGRKAGAIAAPEEEAIPLSPMRKAIAEHMVRSLRTAPHVTSVIEVDMTEIARFREAHREEFRRREGVNLTYLPFIIKATTDALRRFPLLNASLVGETIIVKRAINIGIAVALEDGLIVPVLKAADRKSLTELAREASDLAQRARERRLNPEEVQHGTFTVNNIGAFETLMGTPIIHQPQVAILAYGSVVKRPVALGDAIALRWMAYLCLSYDHRVVDGAVAGQFLKEVKANLEGFDLARALPGPG